MSDNPRHKSSGQPPVSAHPAFPVIVALWFAALLGIGSMVLPIDLFERFAVASGLSDVYQAAQPPLGATARIAVALAAGVIGALVGLFIAGRIAASNSPKTVARRAAALRPSGETATMFAKRPISAHEELGEGGLDADADTESFAAREPFAGRRRALAVTEESAPSEFLDFAPLPGQRAAVFDEPLDLVAFDAPEPEVLEEPETVAEPEPAEETVPIEVTFSEFGSATLSAPPSAFNVPGTAYGEAGPFVRRSAPEHAAGETAPSTLLAERALGGLGIVELVERFALALQRHREQAEQIADMVAVEDHAPGGLTLVPETAITHEVEAPAADFDAQAEDDAPPVPAIPAVLRPIGFDEDDDEADLLPLDLTAALSQGRGAFAAPSFESDPDVAAAQATVDESDDFEDVAEEGYTSLLAMKGPFGSPREPVRIEDDADDEGDEPVVIFPGQAARRAAPASDGPSRDASAIAESARPFDAPLARAQQAAATAHPSFTPSLARKPADSGSTERALRDALEKLQKMSGVA